MKFNEPLVFLSPNNKQNVIPTGTAEQGEAVKGARLPDGQGNS